MDFGSMSKSCEANPRSKVCFGLTQGHVGGHETFCPPLTYILLQRLLFLFGGSSPCHSDIIGT